MQSICLVYLLHSHQHYENEKNSLKILHFMKSLVLLPTFLFLQVCILWHKLCANKPPKQVTALVHGAATLVLFLFLRYYYRGEQITSHLSHLEETVGSTCPWNAVVLVHYQINAVPFALYRYCNRHKPTSFFNEILTKRLLGGKKKMTHATRQITLDWFWQISSANDAAGVIPALSLPPICELLIHSLFTSGFFWWDQAVGSTEIIKRRQN